MSIKVTKYSRQGCTWCKKWDAEEKEYLRPCEFVEVEADHGLVPTFVVEVGEESKRFTGFTPASKLNEAIRELANE